MDVHGGFLDLEVILGVEGEVLVRKLDKELNGG